MVAKVGVHDSTDLARAQAKSNGFDLLRHHTTWKKAQIPSLILAASVEGVLARQVGKTLAGLELDEDVQSIGLCGQQNVPGVNLLNNGGCCANDMLLEGSAEELTLKLGFESIAGETILLQPGVEPGRVVTDQPDHLLLNTLHRDDDSFSRGSLVNERLVDHRLEDLPL